MRTKNGKRIGPVPIAVVAVFALAAMLSAGLITLYPGGVQAQSAPSLALSGTTIKSQTVDVRQALPVMAEAAFTDTVGTDAQGDDLASTLRYAVSSDQDLDDDPDTNVDEREFGTTLAIRSNGASNGRVIAIDNESGVVTIGGTVNASQEHAELSDNTATITVRAWLDGSGTAPAGGTDAEDAWDAWEVSTVTTFDVTIVQDPTKMAGIAGTNPDADDEMDGTQWPGGACEVAYDGSTLQSPAVGSPAARETLQAGMNLISDGKCTSIGEEVEVSFRNSLGTGVDREQLHLVYVTGGATHSKVKPDLAKAGADEHLFDVPGVRAGEDGRHTITVAKSMADAKGRIYLIGYTGDNVTGQTNLEPSDTTYGADASYVILVRFVEGPALAFDADQDDTGFSSIDTPANAEDVDGSTLMATGVQRDGPGDTNKDGYDDGKWTIPNNNDVAITITATIKDANGQPLSAGDKDSRVDFSVAYTAGSDIADSTADFASRNVIDEGENTAKLEVRGWNDSSKAVIVTVSATYTGPTAAEGFSLGAVTLTRSGPAETAEFATYNCVEESNAKASKGCAVDYEAMATNRFGRDDTFTISGKYVDSLGATVSNVQVRVTVDADTRDALTVSGIAGSQFSGRDNVQVSEDAELGMYTITIDNGRTGDAKVSQDLTVFVAGPPVTYELSDQAMYIPAMLGSSQTFTLIAMDENGGVPDFSEAKNAEIVVLGVEGSYVTGRDGNNADFDLETGEATFTIYAPVGATQGQTVLIQVRVDDEVGATQTVMFGVAPTMPGMPINVMAEAASDTEITVSWESPADDGGSAVTGYVLQSKTGTMDFMTIAASSAEIWWNTLDCPMMNAEIPDDATPAPPADDTDMTSPYCAMYAGLSAEATTVVDGVFADEYGTISGTSHSDMGLMPETTYYYRVSAINSAGMGEYSDGMAMAMTMAMMMPPMELGAAMELTAMDTDDGSITLMWTPGDNATHHFVSGNVSAVWEFAGGMNMHTVSADQLVSGTEYTFHVISGRFMEADDGTWPGEWSSAGWTNAAKATAQ